jgi:RNA polymerase sigma-70 factor, ECF subfamily
MMQTALISVLAPIEDESVAIARGLRGRDGDVLDWLIERYQHRLFRYLLCLTSRSDLAEDLFQETWVRVIERGHLYNGRSPFVTWLLTVARNLTIDRLRQRRPESLDALIGAGPDDKPLDIPASEPSAFDLLALQEESDQVSAALSHVSAVFREVLVLRFREELSLEEIADVIGAPLATAKSRLYRGLRALAAQSARIS